MLAVAFLGWEKDGCDCWTMTRVRLSDGHKGSSGLEQMAVSLESAFSTLPKVHVCVFLLYVLELGPRLRGSVSDDAFAEETVDVENVEQVE